MSKFIRIETKTRRGEKVMKKLVVCALCAALVVPTLAVSVQADASKELVLYTWENMFPQEVLDGFEEETGIKIVYSNFDTDENMLEKLSMAKGGDYDVVVADDYIIQTAIEEGLVEKLDTSKLSGWGNINPLYQGQFYDPNDEYTAPYGAGIPLIVYDPDLVDIDIKGYNDLWDPSLRGQHCADCKLPCDQRYHKPCYLVRISMTRTQMISLKQVRNFWSLHRTCV